MSLVFFSVGCVSDRQVKSIDLTKHRGVFVVVFLDESSLRTAAETRLVADLSARGIQAFPSFEDIVSIATSSANRIEAAAGARDAAAVVIINPVNRDGSGSPQQRVSPLHPDIEAFYEHSRKVTGGYSAAREAMLEVDLFILGPEHAERFWSGTVWSFEADGAGAAIPGLSEQIADAMAKARARLVGS